jgi:hypothetical protein
LYRSNQFFVSIRFQGSLWQRRSRPTTETDLKALVDFINASDCIAPDLKTTLVQLSNQRPGEPS